MMLVGTQYSDLVIVCNVNNKPKLLLMRTEYGLGNGIKGKAFIKIYNLKIKHKYAAEAAETARLTSGLI